MSKKDDQILQLTTENVRLSNMIASHRTMIDSMKAELVIARKPDAQVLADTLQSSQEITRLVKERDEVLAATLELQQVIIRLVKERDEARTSARVWADFANREKDLRDRYRTIIQKVIPLFLRSRNEIKNANVFGKMAEKLSDEADELLKTV
jgi:hypothetical protein